MKVVDVTREMDEEEVAGISMEKLNLGHDGGGGNKRNSSCTNKHSLYPEFWRKTQSNPITKAKVSNANNKKKSSIISSNGSSLKTRDGNGHKPLIYPAKLKYTPRSNSNQNLPTSPPLVRNGNLVKGRAAAKSTIKNKLDEIPPVKSLNVSKTKLQPIQEESTSTSNPTTKTTAEATGSSQLVYPILLSPTISLTNFKSLSLQPQQQRQPNQIQISLAEEKKTAKTSDLSNEIKKSSGHGHGDEEREKEKEKQKIIAKRPLKWKARIKISRPEHFNKTMIIQQNHHQSHHHHLTPIPEELINRDADDRDNDADDDSSSDDSLLSSPTSSFQVLKLTNNSSCSKQAMMEIDDALIDEDLASRVGGIYIMSTQAEMMYI